MPVGTPSIPLAALKEDKKCSPQKICSTVKYDKFSHLLLRSRSCMDSAKGVAPSCYLSIELMLGYNFAFTLYGSSGENLPRIKNQFFAQDSECYLLSHG